LFVRFTDDSFLDTHAKACAFRNWQLRGYFKAENLDEFSSRFSVSLKTGLIN
jgi:hypothetical protein